MDALRNYFSLLSYENVTTFIASGNVVFETRDADPREIEARIESHLKESLGYEVPTYLRTPSDIASIAGFRPFDSADADTPGHSLHVGFLREAPGEQAERTLLSFRTVMDDFRVHGSELYWLCRGKITDSLVKWPVVGKAVALTSTMRNVTTIRKLAALYPPA